MKDPKAKSNTNPIKSLRKEQGEQAWIRRVSGSVMSAIGFFLALLVWRWQSENRADRIRAEAFLAFRYELNQALPTLDSLAKSIPIHNQNPDYPGNIQTNSARILLEDPQLISKIHVNTRLLLIETIDFQNEFALIYKQLRQQNRLSDKTIDASESEKYHRKQVSILAKLYAVHCHTTIKHIDELGFNL